MVEHFLGIDVGYHQNNQTTGLCLLTLDQGVLQWECRNTYTDDAVRRNDLEELIAQGTRISAVGIDGPLAHNLVPVGDYRKAESLLSLGAFQRRCKPGPTNSPTGQCLNAHAIRLANIVLDLRADGLLEIDEGEQPHRIHDRRIVEAFPNAFLGVLLRAGHFADAPPRGEKFDYLWDTAVANLLLEYLVQHLAPQTVHYNPLGSITDHDHRAAFICALTAMCITRNQYVAVGDHANGQIILPPCHIWPIGNGCQISWAKAALRENIGRVRQAVGQHANHGAAFVFSNGQPWL